MINANSVHSLLSKAFRASGQAMEKLGRMLEVNPNIDKLQPSTRSVKFAKISPSIKSAFVSPSATVVGKVVIGQRSSIWYGAVLRGDVNTISIGDDVSIGDRAMIHCAGIHVDHPTVIGSNVIVGAGSIIHGCTLGDECIVENGAQVLDGAKVGKHCIIGAGSIVTQGKVVPDGQLWAGVPAQYQRNLTLEEIANINKLVKENFEYAVLHAKENDKTWQMIEDDEYAYHQKHDRSSHYYQQITPEEIQARLGEFENHTVPGRILDSKISARETTHPK